MFGTKLINDRHLAVFLFIIAALMPMAAMVLAPVPLSLDGPSHVYGAMVMRHLLVGDAPFREYFHFAPLLIPNWLASVIAAVIAMPGASRWSIVVMNALLILLTTGALYFVVQRSGVMLKTPEHRFYVLTILMPLAVSGYLIRGFWGFLISVDLCFIAVGLLQYHRLVWHRIVVPMLVLLALWAHPVPVMLTALILVAGYLRATFEDRHSGRNTAKNLAKSFAADILPWCVAALFVASFTFVLASHGPKDPMTLKYRVAYRMADLVQPDALTVLSPTPMAGGLYIVYIALLGVGACAPHVEERVFRWQLAVFAGILLILYFIVPDSVGNANDLAIRLLWMAVMTIGVVAVSGVLGSNMLYLRSCAVCAATIAIVFAGEYLLVSRLMKPAVQELRVALANVPKRSEILLLGYRVTPLCHRWPILEKTVPERHWAMTETIPRDLIVLNDYEPGTEYYPVEYRDQRFTPVESEFNFTVAEEAAWDHALDSADAGTYVLSWGVPSARPGCEAWLEPPLRENLQSHYDLLYQSANNSRVQVWKRRQALPLASMAQNPNRQLHANPSM